MKPIGRAPVAASGFVVHRIEPASIMATFATAAIPSFVDDPRPFLRGLKRLDSPDSLNSVLRAVATICGGASNALTT